MHDPPEPELHGGLCPQEVREHGPLRARLIITNCPGCSLVLDREQWAVNELTGANFQIPVLNYAELAGLLLGWDPYGVVGIQSHTVAVEPLLERIGIPQSSRPAYLREDAEVATVMDGWVPGSGAR